MPPIGNRNSGSRSQERQQDALGQQLAQQPQLAGAESHSKRNLSFPTGGFGQKQVGHVRASDQEDRPHGAQKDPERGSNIPHQVVLEALHEHAIAPATVRIGLFEASGDAVHFGLQQLDRGARPQPADRIEPESRAGVPQPLSDRQRHPQLRFQRHRHPRRHDPDNGMGHASQIQGLAQSVGGSAKAPLPESVAQNHDIILALHLVLGTEPLSHLGLQAQNREKVRHDPSGPQANRFAFAGEVDPGRPECREIFQGVALLFPVGERGKRSDVVADAEAPVVEPQHDEAFRLGERRRRQQHGVDDAEDGCVCSDSKRQGGDCDNRQAGALQKGSNSETDVANEEFHASLLRDLSKRLRDSGAVSSQTLGLLRLFDCGRGQKFP